MNTMMTLIIIIAAIVSITGWICLFRDKDTIASICFILSAGTLIGAASYIRDTKDTPTALDVYRGKTTLEITYRNGIAIDSVVVYKMK